MRIGVILDGEIDCEGKADSMTVSELRAILENITSDEQGSEVHVRTGLESEPLKCVRRIGAQEFFVFLLDTRRGEAGELPGCDGTRCRPESIGQKNG